MYETIQKQFIERGLTWNFSDGARVPSVEELVQTLDKMREALLDSDDQTQVQLGRLILKKDQGHYDVYLHMGELNGI